MSPMDTTLSGIKVLLQPDIRVFEAVLIIALQPLRESYTEFPSSTVIDVRLSQPVNKSPSMEVTLFGMLIEVSPLQ